MTLIVGIICKDGIVIGSDSQSTDQAYMARTDATKIYEITLSDKTSGLVATAGSVDWSLQIVEIMEELAKTATLRHARSFADLAEEANTRIKQRERKPLRRSSRELAEHFLEHRCVLMIANYYKDKPCVYTLTSDDLVSPTLLKKQLYTSVGNSYAIANYLLRKFNLTEMMAGPGAVVAAYVVNEVIQAKDSSCDYPIQFGFVYPHALDGSEGSSAHLFGDSIGNKIAMRVVRQTKLIEMTTAGQLEAAFSEVFEDMAKETIELEQKAKRLESELSKRKNHKSHE